jgi:hypothetical protein
LDFATVLEGYSGSFEPPQNYIVRVCHASYILISTQHIATVFPTDTQNATDNFVSIKTVRKKENRLANFEPNRGDFKPSILTIVFKFLFCFTGSFKTAANYQSLVGSVVIDTELDRKDHDSIPCNCNREGTETT